MAKGNIFASMKPDAKVSRNAFDLSQRHVFSSKSGQIITPFTLETMPNQEVEIDLRQLLRTQPIETAAFTRFKINYDFFFVPYQQLYSSYNQWVAMRKDAQLSNQPNFLNIPNFDFSNIQTLVFIAIHDQIIAENLPNAPVFVEEESSRDFYYWISTRNYPWTAPSLDIIRNLDLLGYGNYLPIVRRGVNRYYEYFKERFSLDLLPDAIRSGIFENGEGSLEQFANLSGLLLDGFTVGQANVALWPFLAQWKVFENVYRNSYYDTVFNMRAHFTIENGYMGTVDNNTDFDYVKLFNLDDFDNIDLNSEDSLRLMAILSLPYHQYKKDLFTGVLPGTQFGDVSVLTDSREWLNLTALNHQGNVGRVKSMDDGDNTLYVAGQVPPIGASYSHFRFDPALAISVLNQRRANALQHFNENLMRAGDRTHDVFKAHWGSEPRSSLKNHALFIGSYDGSIDLNTVQATSPSDGVELGQLGSNGAGVVQGKTIHFKTTDFGIILAFFYIDKAAEYEAYGMDKRWTLLDKFDLPFPELANISFVPVDRRELSMIDLWSDRGQGDTPNILGYLPRFYDRKTAYDKVHGEFFNTSPSNVEAVSQDGYIQQESGIFSNWVTPRRNYAFANGVQWLYHDFREEDSIFYQSSNPAQSSDHFLINAQFDVKSVVPLSVLGLPMD